MIHETHKADCRDLLPVLAAQGRTFDGIFLDVPYEVRGEGLGVQGRNRDLAPFRWMHSSEFAFGVANPHPALCASQTSPVVLMVSGGAYSAKALRGFSSALELAGFTLAARGSMVKTYADGTRTRFLGRPLPPELILVYSLSGVALVHGPLDFSFPTPPRSGYPTHKTRPFMLALLSALGCGPGQVWLDPFAGSASCAKACMELGAGCVSIDIEHDPSDYLD